MSPQSSGVQSSGVGNTTLLGQGESKNDSDDSIASLSLLALLAIIGTVLCCCLIFAAIALRKKRKKNVERKEPVLAMVEGIHVHGDDGQDKHVEIGDISATVI
jgi:heme/copper-type cytochrome/quinol oxidase subunit 2